MQICVRDITKRRWFSGKISRCHRDAPGSIPGRRSHFAFLFRAIIFLFHSFLFSPIPSTDKCPFETKSLDKVENVCTCFLEHTFSPSPSECVYSLSQRFILLSDARITFSDKWISLASSITQYILSDSQFNVVLIGAHRITSSKKCIYQKPWYLWKVKIQPISQSFASSNL